MGYIGECTITGEKLYSFNWEEAILDEFYGSNNLIDYDNTTCTFLSKKKITIGTKFFFNCSDDIMAKVIQCDILEEKINDCKYEIIIELYE